MFRAQSHLSGLLVHVQEPPVCGWLAELVDFDEKHDLRAIFASAKQFAGIKSMHNMNNNGTLVSHC